MDTARLERNWTSVLGRVGRAAARAGRPPESVRLVAVTKTVPAGAVRALRALGARDFGENRVAAGLDKMRDCAFGVGDGPSAVRWHLLGHVQTNKARAALAFGRLHGVDSVRLVRALERHAAEAALPEKSTDVWLEANVSGEASKDGARGDGIAALAQALREARFLRWRGLMAMAPLSGDPEASRPVFRALRAWRDRLSDGRGDGEPLGLSMGMSGDFEVAVEEGATEVRIGTALWEGVL